MDILTLSTIVLGAGISITGAIFHFGIALLTRF